MPRQDVTECHVAPLHHPWDFSYGLLWGLGGGMVGLEARDGEDGEGGGSEQKDAHPFFDLAPLGDKFDTRHRHARRSL